MNTEAAKRILLAYRPSSLDSEDPEVARALELARTDPELQAWLEEHAQFQKAVRTQLRRLPLPPDLKDKILAQEKVVVPMWRRVQFVVAAACLAAGFIIAVIWSARSSSEATFTGFRSRMVSFALRVYRMDIVTNDLAEVRQYLRRQGAPADYALTPGLQTRPVKGGASLSWQGHPVAMVCFSLPREKTLYMFVMADTAIQKGGRPGAKPVLTEVAGIATASWTDQGKVYLIAAETPAAELEKLLAMGGRQARERRVSVGFIIGAGPPQQPIKIRTLVFAEG